MVNLSLGERMKTYYEQAYKVYLPYRMPIIMRLDGKAFHTLTRDMEKPYDNHFAVAMREAMIAVCEEVQGARVAYMQSDEISVLINPYRKLESQPWFGNEIQKMVSVAAGVASVAFSNGLMAWTGGMPKVGVFDCRVFVLPVEEVCNYFIWRQQDAKRNSIMGHAQSMFSHKELQGKNQKEQFEMMERNGLNWLALPVYKKYGICNVRLSDRWVIDSFIPLFTQSRGYVECHVIMDDNE